MFSTGLGFIVFFGKPTCLDRKFCQVFGDRNPPEQIQPGLILPLSAAFLIELFYN